jgi:hypothetical protein
LFGDLEWVSCFFDDVIVQGSAQDETMRRLRAVSLRLQSNNLHLKKSKCQFYQQNVKFLVHQIDSTRLHPLDDKTCAIRTFLGLVNYYNRFMSDLATETLQELALKELYNTQMGMTKNESFGEEPLLLGNE